MSNFHLCFQKFDFLTSLKEASPSFLQFKDPHHRQWQAVPWSKGTLASHIVFENSKLVPMYKSLNNPSLMSNYSKAAPSVF